MNPLLLAGLGAAALLGYLYTRSRGAPASGAPAPAAPPYPPAQLVPKPGKAITAQRIKTLGDLLDKVWSDVTGRPGPMPKWAKEIALAQAAAEMTGYGQGWDGDMAGSWNIASYQCGGNQQDTAYYRCVKHEDSRPNPEGTQTKYVTTFRFYKDGVTPDGKSRSAAEAAAWDFLTSVWSSKRFDMSRGMEAGDVLTYTLDGYKHHYFEGFNLSEAGREAYKDTIGRLVTMGAPIRKAGETAEQVAGRIALYAGSMGRALPEIAQALGHEKVYATVPADVIAFKRDYVLPSGAAAVAGVVDLDSRRHCGRLEAELAGFLEAA
jgi:hypothetical protein